MEQERFGLFFLTTCVVLLVLCPCHGSNPVLQEPQSRTSASRKNETSATVRVLHNPTRGNNRVHPNVHKLDLSGSENTTAQNREEHLKSVASSTDIGQDGSWKINNFSKVSYAGNFNQMLTTQNILTGTELRNHRSLNPTDIEFIPTTRNIHAKYQNIENSNAISQLPEEIFGINDTQACNYYLSVPLTDYRLLDNGSMLALDVYPMMYPPGKFWRHTDQYNETEVRGCICELVVCVRKCCDKNMAQPGEEYVGCKNSSHPLANPFQLEFTDGENVFKNNTNFLLLYGSPCEYGSFRLNPYDPDTADEQFLLYPEGILSASDGNYSSSQFCMEAFEDVGHILPLVCFPPEEEVALESEEDAELYVIYPIGMIISLPFLIATFFVYAAIPELRNLHGKSLMCHVASLFLAYAFLIIVQLGGSTIEVNFCRFSAFAIFFAFHASFFWLNVMCFDIWWTFSGLRPLRGSVKEREYRKFVMYSCYAWGAPLIMLIVCLIMDLMPNIPETYIKPEFGKEKCWFSNKSADLAYFFGPIGVIVLCNMILFAATAFRIIALKRETKMLKGGESQRHDDEANRQRFNLYLKLFVVMGVNWIMEVISWGAGGPKWLWYITDIGNTLQGVFIFVIFVWKRKIRRLLTKKFFPKYADVNSTFEGSTRSRPTPSRTSSLNYTTRTSISNQDHLVLKPMPSGTYSVNHVP